ncbi:MAG: DUF2723 domain-containing protein [Chloroflexota bacterium]
MTRAASTAAIATVLALATFVTYAVTLAPGVLGGDAGELQFVSPILGLTHPTGYPLLVLLNHAWALLFPLGNVAWRLNVLNAAFAAGAIGVLCVIGRVLSGSALAGVIGALFLALSPIYWSQATASDKYTLNALFLALVILAALHWSHRPNIGRLSLLALLYGLSLTNHRSMLLAGPGLLFFVGAHGVRPVLRWSSLLPIVLLLAPLALYAYVPWAGARALPPGTWPVGTLTELIEFFLDRGYTSEIRLDGGTVGRLVEFARVTFLQLGVIGPVLGVLGLSNVLRQRPRVGVLLVLILIPTILAAANYVLQSHYAIPRYWVFFIPVYVVWAIFIGVGVRVLLSLARRTGARPMALYAAVTALIVAFAAPVWWPTAVSQARAHRSAETLDGYRQDLQRGYLADRFARLALRKSAPNGIIVGDWEQVTALWYLQYVEGERPDVSVRYPIERLDVTLADATLAARAVYATRTLPGIERLGPTSSVGPLIQVRGTTPRDPISSTEGIDAELGASVRLVSAEYLSDDLKRGGVLPLVLYWMATVPNPPDASVSVRLVSSYGEDVAQSDVSHPALGTSPMSGWSAGHVIGDYHELGLSNRLPAGEYTIQALAYRGPAGTPLSVQGRDAHARGDRVNVGSVTLPR